MLCRTVAWGPHLTPEEPPRHWYTSLQNLQEILYIAEPVRQDLAQLK